MNDGDATLETVEHFLRIALWVHLGVEVADSAVGVDHDADAFGEAGFLVGARAVGEADRSIGVAEEREVELVLLTEGAVLFSCIEARAEDRRVLGLEGALEIAEPATLQRSSRGVGLWIKPQHHDLAAQVAELHQIALIVERLEVGGLIAGCQHSDHYCDELMADAS